VISRLGLVPRPGGDPVRVIAALLDGVDVVAVGEAVEVRDADARRLSAWARHRGSVLLPLGACVAGCGGGVGLGAVTPAGSGQRTWSVERMAYRGAGQRPWCRIPAAFL
jgi:hypothetical protein